MDIYARQGDLVIEKLSAPIAGELETMTGLVLAGGSSGHKHVVLGAAQYRREGSRTLLRIAKKTELVHERADGHRPVPLAAGDYEIRPLREGEDDGVDVCD